jgi:hypothetical protein
MKMDRSEGETMVESVFEPGTWSGMSLMERRTALADAVLRALGDGYGVQQVTVEVGPVGREYDLTLVVHTDVGRIRTPLWSHARSQIFCDESIHAANRMQIGPSRAVSDAVDRLRRRLAVPYRLESRGLTVEQIPEEGVTRTWTAEHSRFRKRTAVTREDVVERAADLDVRDLLAHFYSGPALRLVSEEGEPFLLTEAIEVDGDLITLCRTCSRWSEGSSESCPECGGSAVESVIAARPPRR